MEKLWFVCINNVTSGPFTTVQLKEQAQAGKIRSEALVWWKGQREWMSLSEWQKQLDQILSSEKEKVANPIWYVDILGTQVGPLTQTEMIEHLHGIANLADVKLWSVALNKWTNLFELQDIMNQLGISRRNSDRAPLLGIVSIIRPGEETVPAQAKAASISVGGIGLNEATNLTRGEEVQLLIKSSEFHVPLRLSATVMYVTPTGQAGLRFGRLSPEIQSVLFDYIKKFSEPIEEKKVG